MLTALQTADASRGNRKPVLAVGRDGITLCEYRYRFWEVATTATVTVFDRAGKRLATVSLAFRPELGQATMSQMLTGLLTEVLQQWQGPLPTLAYVADSGGQESSYFEDALAHASSADGPAVVLAASRGLLSCGRSGVDHGRNPLWEEHASLPTLGPPDVATLETQAPGAKRVLHSAASLVARRKLGKSRTKEFRKAYNYLRKRTQWMRYSEYKNRHIPLGSGITEAACKTVYTQRLKLSGMRWKRCRAQQILTLRTTLLSHIWDDAYTRLLATRKASLPTPYTVERRPARSTWPSPSSGSCGARSTATSPSIRRSSTRSPTA